MEQTRIKIAGIAYESIVDGPGLRTTIFFQGCIHACDGCHNPNTWNFNGGMELTLTDLVRQLRLNPLISGITYSGGEPLLQAEAAAKLGRFLKKLGLDLWIYTGYYWEEIINQLDKPGIHELLQIASVIVDGPFVKEQKTATLPFRGSANQRVILVAESLKSGKIIEWTPEAVIG